MKTKQPRPAMPALSEQARFLFTTARWAYAAFLVAAGAYLVALAFSHLRTRPESVPADAYQFVLAVFFGLGAFAAVTGVALVFPRRWRLALVPHPFAETPGAFLAVWLALPFLALGTYAAIRWTLAMETVQVLAIGGALLAGGLARRAQVYGRKKS